MPHTIETSIDDLVMKPLTLDVVERLFDLVQANREHLTAFGDYEDLVVGTKQDLASDILFGRVSTSSAIG
jgi:hypothetical protein